MSPKKITQIFSQLLLIGAFIPISIGNAMLLGSGYANASEIPTVEVSAVDLYPEADAKVSQISGIKDLNLDLSSGKSHLYLAQRKKPIKKKPIKKKQIEKGSIKNEAQSNNDRNNNRTQIQTEQINTRVQIQNIQPNSQPQIENRLTTQTQIQNSDNNPQPRSSFYFSGGGGLFFPSVGIVETNTGGANPGTASVNLGLGSDIGFHSAVGFKSSSFWRTELELVGTKSSSKNTTDTFSQIAAMFNGYYDLSTGSKFTPYVAAGIGYGMNYFNGISTPGGLAYQLKAGAEYEIADRTSIFLQYRYWKNSESKGSGANGLNNIQTLTITPSSSSIEFGTRYSF